MFNLGFSEILFIGVLALILIGPKQLPDVARALGRLVNEFKKATQDLSGGLLEIRKDLKDPLDEVTQSVVQSARQVYDEMQSAARAPQETAQKFHEKMEAAVTGHDAPTAIATSGPTSSEAPARVDSTPAAANTPSDKNDSRKT